MTATAAPAASPLRIERLTLTDFRAFPGPVPVDFDFGGKNLLVYGENGSGKSSIFYALREFFNLTPKQSLKHLKNIYSGKPVGACQVEVLFNDGAALASWRLDTRLLPVGVANASPLQVAHAQEVHPGKTGRYNDARVAHAALRRACLDYRALLDTNYLHGEQEINLFDIAVNLLLKDYPVTVPGGTTSTLGEVWQKVKRAVPWRQNSRTIKQANDACAIFNPLFRDALDTIHPHIVTILQKLIGNDISLAPFQFSGTTYGPSFYRDQRQINGCTLHPEISQRAQAITRAQNFLNEAKLSALGLAIYLAGRLTCTPTISAGVLKLLVLDDVLIGLDHQNRLPVLDLLKSHFSDWQIVLMTHDRNWFDMARNHLPRSDWLCYELFEGDPSAPAPMPIVRQSMNRPAPALLQKAEDILNQGYLEAAANYVRQSFETGIRTACDVKNIKMVFRQNPARYQSQSFVDALKSWPGSSAVPKADWDAVLHRLELLKNVVMNPYSHPNAPNIPRSEIVDAIAAVRDFLDLVRRN